MSQRENVVWGVSWIVPIAAFVGLAEALRAQEFNRPLLGSVGAVASKGPAVLAWCLSIGLVGGVVVGLLRPFFSKWFGLTVAGAALGILYSVMIAVARDGAAEFRQSYLLFDGAFGAIVGGLLGLKSWARDERRRLTKKD